MVVTALCMCTAGNGAGFKTSNTSCCHVDTTVGGLCLPTAQLCPDRKDFVFWDAYHTSDAANQIIANRLFADMVGSGTVVPGNGTTAPRVASAPVPTRAAGAPKPTRAVPHVVTSPPKPTRNAVPRVVTTPKPKHAAAKPPRKP
jgi:hypothetical protein